VITSQTRSIVYTPIAMDQGIAKGDHFRPQGIRVISYSGRKVPRRLTDNFEVADYSILNKPLAQEAFATTCNVAFDGGYALGGMSEVR
jgi:hypothetical protein